MALFTFLTGASGAGKSLLMRRLEEISNLPKSHFAYFDTIGVPTEEEMLAQFGSREKWQEHATHEWVERLLAHLKDHPGTKLLFLEGQFNPQFALDACERHGIANTLFLVAHASRPIRESRLKEHRRQPELATQEMQNWADFLRKKTVEIGGHVVDTSPADPQRGVSQILLLLLDRLKAFNAA